jgi:TonB family protein
LLFDAELGERLLAYVASLNLPSTQVDRAAASIQNRFGYNADAATRDAFNTKKTQWESTLQQQTGIAGLTAAEDRTAYATVYPQRVCLATDPGEIRVGALVGPDGTWQGEPVLLRSSGYGSLDRKALQEIQSQRFAPGEGLRAYVLTIKTSVEYGSRPCLGHTPDT